MNRFLIYLLAISAASGAAISVSEAALPQQTPAKPDAANGAAIVLSEEDQNADPFPAAPNAALARKVCSGCHSLTPVLDQRYSREDAERYYANMVSGDLGSKQAQKVIAFLSTALGQ